MCVLCRIRVNTTLRMPWGRFDEDSSGALSFEELSGVFGCLGMNISVDQVNEAMRSIDQNNDGEPREWPRDNPYSLVCYKYQVAGPLT